MLHLWCIKKMKEQQHTKSVKKDINIVSMGFAPWRQHSEKLKHQELFSTFESVSHRP